MSDPYLVMDYGQTYIYYTCDRDPTSNEPLVMQGYSNMLMFWWNQTTNSVWQCVVNTVPMVWNEIADSANILGILGASWGINTSRSYVQRSSPAFDTPYMPSATNDTNVIATVSLTSTLLTAAEVDVQINTGSGFVTLIQESMSGISASSTCPLAFTVPAGASYRLTSISGTTSIVQIMELKE